MNQVIKQGRDHAAEEPTPQSAVSISDDVTIYTLITRPISIHVNKPRVRASHKSTAGTRARVSSDLCDQRSYYQWPSHPLFISCRPGLWALRRVRPTGHWRYAGYWFNMCSKLIFHRKQEWQKQYSIDKNRWKVILHGCQVIIYNPIDRLLKFTNYRYLKNTSLTLIEVKKPVKL